MKKKILIIEDDRGISKAMEILLTEESYQVSSVGNGIEAVSHAIKFKPDLIFLDMLLSGTDGREVCAGLKNNKKTKDMRIVMTSAHPKARESVKECGADDYLAKPFTTDELLRMASKFTKRKV